MATFGGLRKELKDALSNRGVWMMLAGIIYYVWILYSMLTVVNFAIGKLPNKFQVVAVHKEEDKEHRRLKAYKQRLAHLKQENQKLRVEKEFLQKENIEKDKQIEKALEDHIETLDSISGNLDTVEAERKTRAKELKKLQKEVLKNTSNFW